MKLFNRLIKLLLTGMVFLMAPPAMAAITGSAHDFTSLTGGQGAWSGGEICTVCHTPHNGDTGQAAPLWDHAISSATYTPYTSGTLDGSPATTFSGISKLCMSCHDGTVALDSFGGATGSVTMSGNTLVGVDLRNDHPVALGYQAAITAGEAGLNATGDTTSLGNTVFEDYLFGATAAVATVECASCHDVHNEADNSSLLRATLVGSALCLDCHNK